MRQSAQSQAMRMTRDMKGYVRRSGGRRECIEGDQGYALASSITCSRRAQSSNTLIPGLTTDGTHHGCEQPV
jgi:hypothetical protein